MRQRFADRLEFFRAYVSNPRQVGSVTPTSRRAVRDMPDRADIPAADLVVEIGAGTGVQTAEILRRLSPSGRLVVVEIAPRLVRLLQEQYSDPRLQIVCDSAENVASYLGGRRADVVVSGQPFGAFEPDLRRRTLDKLPTVVADDGTVLVLQYTPFLLGEMRRRFATVRRRFSPLNVPPALLLACRDPRPT